MRWSSRFSVRLPDWPTMQGTLKRELQRVSTPASGRADEREPLVGVVTADLIRVNVSGAELPFLQGAARTLSADGHQGLVMDLHPQRGTDVAGVCELLQQYGFHVHDIRDVGRQPLKITPDLRCVFAIK